MSLHICLISQEESWFYFDENNSQLPSNSINSLSINKSGMILIGTNKGLVEYDASKWTTYNSNNSGIPYNGILKVLIDDNHNYWLNSDGGIWGRAGLTNFNGEEWFTYNTTNSQIPFNGFNSIVLDQAGKIWLGSVLWGIASFHNDVWSHFTTSNSSLIDNNISAIDVDSENNIWIGTAHSGLLKISNTGDWISFNESNSELPDNSIVDVFITSNNDIWIVSSNYVTKYSGDAWSIYNLSDIGLTYFPTVACHIDLNDNLWIISNGEGILMFDGNNWEKFDKYNSPLPTNQFTDLIVDRNNNKWFGSAGSGIVLYNENGVLLDSLDQSFQWPVIAPRITQDFATYGSVVPDHFHNGIDMTSSLSVPTATTVFAAQKGTVLIQNNTCAEGDHCGNGFGNYVVLEHSKNLYTLYAHLNVVDVTVGQYINRGQRIGIMGATGRPDYSNHLHFEVLKYPPASSSDFGGGYSNNFPDLSYRNDPKDYLKYNVVKVSTDNLNVRQSPTLNGTIFNSISSDQYYITIDQYDNWYLIYLPYKIIPDTSDVYVDVNRYGWVSGNYLGIMDQSLYQIVKIDGNKLWLDNKETWINVHSSPSSTSLELTKIWPGQKFIALENVNEWYKINLPTNTGEHYGWVKLNSINGIMDSTHSLSYILSNNYPNPFNPTTTINYQVPYSQRIKLIVYDQLGRLVEILVDDFKEMGKHSVNFNASNISSGIYFYRLDGDSFRVTKKMLLLK